MRLRACACWLIMTPELVERVDAWISANIALLEPESGFREAMAFNLRYGWIEARGGWLGYMYRNVQGEAVCRVAAAAMRGILLEFVRWAWDDQLLYAVVLDVTPAHSNRVLCMRWTVIQPSRNGGVVGMWETEDEIGGAS